MLVIFQNYIRISLLLCSEMPRHDDHVPDTGELYICMYVLFREESDKKWPGNPMSFEVLDLNLID
jgi:hypothetical protein